jgi:GntR family transcriptional regulator, N-acetylglucosamine utilization regulator
VPHRDLDAGVVAAALRPDGTSPLHVQIEDGLRRLIRSGRVPVGAELPGELDLAATLGLSRHTIRHALSTLAAEGLVQRERGRGTRVAARSGTVQVRQLDSFYAFAWEVAAQGKKQRSHVLESVLRVPPAEVAKQLLLESHIAVLRLVRVRMADDEPLVIETAYIPPEFAHVLSPDVLDRASVYDLIESHYRLHVTRAEEIIRPTVLSQSLAGLLNVRAGSAAFRVERTTWACSRPIEWQESIVRGDRFLYSVELDRGATHSISG